MDDRLYNKTIKCPVCSKNFEITKVKAKACKVVTRDTDLCIYYEDLNPIFYDVWVCENCGYSAQADKFEAITDRDIRTIREVIAPKWVKRSFAGERSLDSAIEAFKLALYNSQVRKAKSGELAKICIRIAWLYRIKKHEKEQDFLKFALRSYTEAYEVERFPIEKMDELTCMYMIAELNRRTGNIEESIKWFSRLISSPDARKNPNLIETARDQYMLVKEQKKNNDSSQIA